METVVTIHSTEVTLRNVPRGYHPIKGGRRLILGFVMETLRGGLEDGLELPQAMDT